MEATLGAAGMASLAAVVKFTQHSLAAAGLTEAYSQRLELVKKYRDAYRRYCWPVKSLAD